MPDPSRLTRWLRDLVAGPPAPLMGGTVTLSRSCSAPHSLVRSGLTVDQPCWCQCGYRARNWFAYRDHCWAIPGLDEKAA